MFKQGLVVCSLILGLLCIPLSAIGQPNVVVIVVDDMRWDDFGAGGHPFRIL